MGRERTNVSYNLYLAPSEYLALHEAARELDLSMAEYLRIAMREKYNREHPNSLGFGEPYRLR